MMLEKETVYTKDPTGNRIKVEREFDAPVEKVWAAWTKSDLLDQWWAPKPWKANTQSMDFRAGGKWLYYMEGPEGERHYCRVDYENITKPSVFTGYDAFCDEKGNITNELPRMHWRVEFIPQGDQTNTVVTITFDSEADLDKIVEMGFKEGFAAAHKNLDELLQG
jgi:uncharacterized protein YndB with AHSA1/START domain